MLITLIGLFSFCTTPGPLNPTLWLNSVLVKADSKRVAGLKTDLERCAKTASALPRSCKRNDRYITKGDPETNCHWTCGQICKDDNECLWKVTAGPWNLNHAVLTAATKEPNTSCGAKWQSIFDDPGEYEQPTCEQECLQMNAIVALSRVDPACAMNLFGIEARRPSCVGEIPKSCLE